MRTRGLAQIAALSAFVALGGCGSDPPSADKAAATGRQFVHAIAKGDPQACDLVTDSGDEQIRVQGSNGGPEEGCARLVANPQTLVPRLIPQFAGRATTPSEVSAGLDAAKTELTSSGDAKFTWCTPSEVEVQIRLVESDSSWLIDGLLTSQETVSGPNFKRVKPCRLD